MSNNGRSKGYSHRGGQSTAERRKHLKWENMVEFDHCSCGGRKFPTQYVCMNCLRVYTNMNPTPLLLADKPDINRNGRSCRQCNYHLECRDLVIKNYPVRCEIWDELDMILLAPEDFS